ERVVDLVALGDDQEPRRAAIEAMDDPGAPGVLAAGGTAVERLREGPRPMTASGMHDQAGRLVDDEQVGILEGDPELDSLPGRRIDRVALARRVVGRDGDSR